MGQHPNDSSSGLLEAAIPRTTCLAKNNSSNNFTSQQWTGYKSLPKKHGDAFKNSTFIRGNPNAMLVGGGETTTPAPKAELVNNSGYYNFQYLSPCFIYNETAVILVQLF